MKNHGLKKTLWITGLSLFLFCDPVCPKDSQEAYYEQGIEAAKSGDLDSAFMYFRLLLANHPESEYKRDVLFATGEYYFNLGDYRDANKAFIQLVSDCPDSEIAPFALMYLLKIAQNQGNEGLAKILENKIVTLKQIILLFKYSKEYTYRSPFCKIYKLIYYIDKIQFYSGRDLFAQISY